VEIAVQNSLAGFICGNTSTSREGLQTKSSRITEIGNGGLSGKPLKQRALSLVRRVAKTKLSNQQIIACGGISSGQDAYEFIEAGATALQLYTALVYHGPTVVARINRELSQLINQRGKVREPVSG
jgi:dihydroorotate dehydrogenase